MKEEIREQIESAIKETLRSCGRKKIQMFNCFGFIGERKVTLFYNGEIGVFYTPGYEYIELLGLREDDYNYFFRKYGY